MDVSVVVVTYNRPESLRLTIAALAAQTRVSDEVVIVDNGSNVDCAEVVKQFSDDLNIVYKYIEKSSIAVGRNVGAYASQGDIVAFTDDDCIPHETWVENIIASFQRDEKTVAIGGKISSYKKESFIDSYFEEEYRLYGEHLKRFHYHRQAGDIMTPYLITANAAFRKTALQEIGFFDESFGRAEDVDISIRMHNKGWQVLYEESALVYHQNRATIGAFLKQYFNYGYYDVKLYLKHFVVARRLHILFKVAHPEDDFGTIKKVFTVEFPFIFPCYIIEINIYMRIVILIAAFFYLLCFSDLWGFLILCILYFVMYKRFMKSDFKKVSIDNRRIYVVIRVLAAKVALLGQFYSSIKRGMIILLPY